MLTVCSNEVENHRGVAFPSILCFWIPGGNADCWSLDSSSVLLGGDHHHPLCLVPPNGWQTKVDEESGQEKSLQERSQGMEYKAARSTNMESLTLLLIFFHHSKVTTIRRFLRLHKGRQSEPPFNSLTQLGQPECDISNFLTQINF